MDPPLHGRRSSAIRLGAIAAALLLAIPLATGCRRGSEAEDFDRAVASLSLQKAREFMEAYPESERVDDLRAAFRATCLEDERPRECLSLLEAELPDARAGTNAGGESGG